MIFHCLFLFPISVNATRTVYVFLVGVFTKRKALGIARIVYHSIDHGDRMAADVYDKPPGWQFVFAQVNLASASDLHRRRPDESQRFHIILEPLAFDFDTKAGRPRAADSALRPALASVSIG